MSISSLSGSTTSSTATQISGNSSRKQVHQDFKALASAIQSGSLSDAQSAYDSLSQLLGANQSATSTTGSSTTTSNSQNPMAKMLSAVGNALKTGDISQVQQAFAANGPQGAGQSNGAPPPPPPGGDPDGDGDNDGGNSDRDKVRDAMGQLGQSLQSGSMSDAQSAYSTLTDLLSSLDGSSSSSSTSKSSTSKSSTSSTSSNQSPQDKFKSAISQLGNDLQSGDLSSALQLFTQMTPRGSGLNLSA